MSHRTTSRFVTAALILFGLSTLIGACGEKAPPPPPPEFAFPVEVSVKTTTDDPLPKVPVTLDGNVVGFTDKDGKFVGTIKAKEGEQVKLGVQPLDGYRFTTEAEIVDELSLTRIGGSPQPVPVGLQMKAQSLKNDYFFWVSLDCDESLKEGSCKDLPVLINGEEVARTNREGYAHFTLTEVPEKKLEMKIETPEYDAEDEESQMMEPRDPTYEVALDLEPHVYMIGEKFVNPIAKSEQKTKKRRRRNYRRRRKRRRAKKKRSAPKKKATKKKETEGKKGGKDGVIDLW